MQGKVEICGVNTAKLPVLKAAETRALIERAQQGDMAAREELISGNLRLVLSVIQKFAGRGESLDDLFQVGVIGLIKAVDCFDLNQKVQFSTYGVPMIAGELRRFLRDHSAIRVSRSMRDTAYKVLQTKERLTAEQGREPDLETIAKELGLPMQIHDRDSHREVIDTLLADGSPERTVFHSYSGDADMGRVAAEHGWYLSFSGTVSYKGNDGIRESARLVGLDHIMVETDAPYLTPMPYRGRTNAPYMIPYTLAALADVFDLPIAEVARATRRTTREVYGV